MQCHLRDEYMGFHGQNRKSIARAGRAWTPALLAGLVQIHQAILAAVRARETLHEVLPFIRNV